jgi:tRNA-uridine 2-sulfurtransferase
VQQWQVLQNAYNKGMSHVVLAMSGGVDSSVAAWLLREQGHDVVGLFMRHGQDAGASFHGSSKQGCCSAADAGDARRVADKLGIPFYAVNFQQEFDRIVDYFVAEYTVGRTPNPCVVCNTWLKFGRMFDYADSIGADYVATGHYARLVSLPDGQTILCRAVDSTKDQSYVLFGIQRRLLPRLMFPLGEYRKEDVRRIAEQIGLRVAAKRDSQEICFVPDQDHARFIRQQRPGTDTSGEIVTTDGTVVGHHDGFEQFTIGQRKGLRVAFGEPRYVVKLDAASHHVVIGTREQLARDELYARDMNWLAETRGERRGERGEGKHEIADCEMKNVNCKLETPCSLSSLPFPLFRAQVKIRYRSPAADADVELLPGNRFRVHFDAPCYAIGPGQAAVCYDGDRVLGGGWIE